MLQNKKILTSLFGSSYPKSGDLDVVRLTFDKKMVEVILDNLNKKNRRLKERAIKKYKEDMNAGRFYWTENIVFDENGWLRQGQHRLTAFLASDLEEITAPVFFNADEESIKYLDTGVARSKSDYFVMSGMKREIPAIIQNALKGQYLMIKNPPKNAKDEAKRFKCEYEPNGVGIDAIEELYECHKEAVDYVFDMAVRCGWHSKTNPSRSSVVLAVFVRAYYSQNHAQLELAMKNYTTGEVPGDLGGKEKRAFSAIASLRDLFRKKVFYQSKWEGKKGATLWGLYGATNRLLFLFCEGKGTSQILFSDTEHFPVPTLDRVTSTNVDSDNKGKKTA